MAFTSPVPIESYIVDQDRDRTTGKLSWTGYMSATFADWLLELVARINDSPEQQASVSRTGQQASIGTTPLPMPNVSAGLYRITVYARVTRPGTVSSSLAVTIGWTDGTVTCSYPFAAVTGNTTATVLVGTITVRSDQAGALTYATTYATAGATDMQYAIDLVVEAL